MFYVIFTLNFTENDLCLYVRPYISEFQTLKAFWILIRPYINKFYTV